MSAAHSTSANLEPNVADPTGTLSRVYEEQQGYLARGRSQLREVLRDREGQAVLAALAAGVGVGLLLSGAIAGPRRGHHWRDRLAAEGIGRRLLENVDRILPSALTDRFS